MVEGMAAAAAVAAVAAVAAAAMAAEIVAMLTAAAGVWILWKEAQ